MKRFYRTLLCMALATVAVSADAQKKVHNEDTYNQLASMEFKHWKFTPKGDYYSKVRKKFLFISYDVPGQGYHDDGWFGTGAILPLGDSYASYVAGVTLTGELERLTKPDHYVDEDWRLMSPLRASAYGEALLQKNYINKEDGYWRGIRAVDVLTIADRSGLIGEGVSLSAVDVTENDRNDACRLFLQNHQSIEGTEEGDALMLDYQRIQASVTAIRNAHMDDARKSVELHKYNRQFQELNKKAFHLGMTRMLCDSVVYKGLPVPDGDKPFNDMQPSTLDKVFTTGLRILEQIVDFNKL